MTFVSDEVMVQFKETLADIAKSWKTGVCRGEAFRLDGKKIQCTTHNSCHAWVNRAYADSGITCAGYWSYKTKTGSGAKNFVILNCHTKAKSYSSEEGTRAILHWFAKKSPFSAYFLNRDDDESLENGAILLCGPDGATLSEAMWIFKVLRYSTEGSNSLDVWNTLYQEGVDPFLAILVCTYIGSVQGASFGVGGVTGHVTVFRQSPDATEISLEKLLNHKFDRNSETTAEFFAGKDDCSGKIKGFCKPILVSDGWGGTTEGTASQLPNFIKCVKEWEDELKAKYLIGSRKRKLPTSTTVFLEEDM